MSQPTWAQAESLQRRLISEVSSFKASGFSHAEPFSTCFLVEWHWSPHLQGCYFSQILSVSSDKRDTGFSHPRLKFPAKKVIYKHTSFTSTRPERVRAEHSLDAVFTLLLLTAKRKTPVNSFIGQSRKNNKGSLLFRSAGTKTIITYSVQYIYILVIIF